jgi:chromosome segregation ATPase
MDAEGAHMKLIRQFAATTAWLIAGWLTGCTPPPVPQPEPSAEQVDQLRRRLDQQAEQIRLLQTTVSEKEATIADLRVRASVLANHVRGLQGEAEQLNEQLKVVGDAPRQRDTYKALYEQLQVENRRLQADMDALKPPASPATTTQSGTDP